MTGREWKRQQEIERTVKMANEFIVNFLDNNLDTPNIYNEIKSSRIALEDLYPALKDLDEQSEDQVSAFCAGMLFLIMYATEMGIKWLTLLPPVQDDTDGE